MRRSRTVLGGQLWSRDEKRISECPRVMQKMGVKMPEHIFDKSYTAEFGRNMLLIDVAPRGKIGKIQKLLKEGQIRRLGITIYELRCIWHVLKET